MKTTVYRGDFIDAFRMAGRQDDFSYVGLKALYDSLIDYEESTGEEAELDVIALCCEFTEWNNITEFLDNNDEHFREHWEEIGEEGVKEMFEYIQGYTTIIDIDGTSFITQVF